MEEVNIKTAMDGFLDNYFKNKNQKLMLIDANTGQGKTISAMKWIEKTIKDEEYKKDDIKDIKFFYLTPQKNSWPKDIITKSDILKKKTAFLFSNEDTMSYLKKQYKVNGNIDKSANNLCNHVLNEGLKIKVKIASKKNIKISLIYEELEHKVIKFSRCLFNDDNNYCKDLSKELNNIAFSLKKLINEIYKNNKKARKEILNPQNKTWKFIYELYSSMYLLDDSYNLYITSVDKILYPLETIFHGKVNLIDLRKIYGNNTLLVFIIDEWDDAYTRFSRHYYKKHEDSSCDILKTIRRILNIKTENLPKKYDKLKIGILGIQNKQLRKYPNTNNNLIINKQFKFVANNDKLLVSSNYNNKLMLSKTTNEITVEDCNKGHKELEDFIIYSINNIIDFVYILYQFLQNENELYSSLNYVLNLFDLTDNNFIINLIDDIKNCDKNKEGIIIGESINIRNEERLDDIKVTYLPSPIENIIKPMIKSDNNIAPSIMLGMSATIRYKTIIDNLDLSKVANNDEIYHIPEKERCGILNNYKRKNNYYIKDNEIEENVIIINNKYDEIENNDEIMTKIKGEIKTLSIKASGILNNKKEANLIYKELEDAINNSNLYTTMNLIRLTDVLMDARKKDIKNMLLFSTNSYKNKESNIILKYMYTLKLIDDNIIKTKEEIKESINKEIIFADAKTLNNSSTIQKSLNEQNRCYIVTSYASAARGINLYHKINENEIKNNLIGKIDPSINNPKANDKVDIQAVYLQKPTHIIPMLPSGINKINDYKKLETINTLYRLYNNNSITKEDFLYWLTVEIGGKIDNLNKAPYPSNCLDGRISAIKLATQAMGRRTRVGYRYRKCYTYIDDSLLINHPWEDVGTYNTLSINKQIKEIIKAKKTL